MRKFLSEQFEKITKELFNKQPLELYEPIIYTMNNQGKLIRPLLLLNSKQFFGGTAEGAIKAAYAMELFHNFTLLHDDVMDKAKLRRGELSVFTKYGTTSAILSGDAMVLYAKKILLDYGDIAPILQQLFTQTGIEICEGQQMDMNFETRSHVSESEYLEMIKLKTAVLLASCLKMGAILAKTTEANQNAIYQLGINIGLAFQLKDDLLDAFGESAAVGKLIGGDIIENKKTLLMIFALQNANDIDLSILSKWQNTTEFSQQKIDETLQIFERTGAKNRVEELITAYYDRSVNILNSLEGAPKPKQNLLDLCELIKVREY